MATAKTPNYTEAMIASIVTRYTAVRTEDQDMRDSVVADLAAEYHKSPKGIIAKLAAQTIVVDGTKEKLYLSKVKVSGVTNEVAKKKEALAVDLVTVIGLNLVSAEKLNKRDIQALIEYSRAANSMAAEYADLVAFVTADMPERESEV